MDPRLNWMISVDDHVLEPKHVWESRLPSKYREAGPRLRRDEQGEAWFYEDKRSPTIGLAAVAGKKTEEFSPLPITYDDMRPGCYDPGARVEDMLRDGVLASLCFPSFPRYCGQVFSEGQDKELGLACIRAYNDWMIDEWSGSAPGRFIPMIIMPLWDPMLAATEIERTAAKGAKAIAFSENPAQLGYPSIYDRDRYWDPVLAAANDTKLPLCTHVGSSSRLPKTSDDMPMLAVIVYASVVNMIGACTDWLFSGVLQRYPDVKLCLSEGGIGWIPYVLDRCEWTLDRHRAWGLKGEYEGDLWKGNTAAVGTGSSPMADIDPMQLFREHIYGCFITDPHGIRSLEEIGVDNVMIETDYPHSDSAWPNSLETAHNSLEGWSDEVKYKVLRGNAERVFNFTAAAPPGAVA